MTPVTLGAVARGALGVVIGGALAAGVATIREMRAGDQAIVEADAALARGDVATATLRAHDAAEAVAPGSPYPRQGYARLEAIARAAEAKRDERQAIAAWGAMRAAATATESPFTSTRGWRTLADDGLVRNGSAKEGAAGEVHATEETLRTSLAREDAPATGLLAALGLGALAFFAGCGRLLVAAKDAPSLRREKLAVATAAAGALVYALVCLRA